MSSILRWIVAATLVIGSLIVLSALVDGELGYTRGHGLLSLVVIVLGGTFIVGDLTFPVGRKQQRLGWVGVGATAVAVVISFLLIWSDLITHRYLWKAWWFSAAISVNIAHVLAILRARTTPKVLLVVRNATLVTASLFAAILVGMTFRHNVLSMPGGILSLCLYVFGAAQILGSVILWIWARPAPGTRRLPVKVLRVAWRVALPVLVLAGGFYFGRITSPPAGMLDYATGLLARLPPETIDEHIDKDLSRLHVVVEGIEGLREKSRKMYENIVERRKNDPSMRLTAKEQDEIQRLFVTYLSYRAVLLRMVAYYQGFEGASDPQQRARCFLLGYTAGTTIFSASLSLVEKYRDDDLVRKKLNEAELKWSIPEGMFKKIVVSVASKQNSELFEEMAAYFDEHEDRWDACDLEPRELEFLQGTIKDSVTTIRNNPLYGRSLWMQITLARVKRDAYTPVLAVQTLVSTWIGDTRLLSRPPCISAEQVEEMRAQLEPGDIILERRNWFLSNAFLPGFWPHAALYVGTHDDLKELGIAEKPEVLKRLKEYLIPAHDGEHKVVIESISEGVSFTSLSEATRADYIAILRPRLTKEEKAKAIVNAFSHQGKPYDFEFSFDTKDKLVCTELVWRSYSETIDFPLEVMMGVRTMPAVKIAKKYGDERGTPQQQLEFILFLDTPEGSREATFSDEEAFVESAERPKAFNE